MSDIKTGDLCDSKLHKGWCLVTDTFIETKIYRPGIGLPVTKNEVVRFKLLHVKEQKEYEMTLRANSPLTELRNYKFFRDGAPLV